MDVQRPFCTAAEFTAYLSAYAEKFNLTIQLHRAVETITKDEHGFKLTAGGHSYQAPFVLVTTGFLSNPYIPDLPGFRHNARVIHAHDFRRATDFRGKRVIIIGAGNSAAETALAICGNAQTYLYTRKKLRFFSKTRNLCHIRGISESLLLELIKMKIIHYVPNSHILKFENQVLVTKNSRLSTDYIICATGYQPHLPMLKTLPMNHDSSGVYPQVTKNCESVQVANLFFGGPLARFRLSSQFIHGFIKNVPVALDVIENRLHNIY